LNSIPFPECPKALKIFWEIFRVGKDMGVDLEKYGVEGVSYALTLG
jgi:hypothetical protein